MSRNAEALEEEKNTAAVFQRLPFHYLEIAKLLFTNAKESIGTEFLKVTRTCDCACLGQSYGMQ